MKNDSDYQAVSDVSSIGSNCRGRDICDGFSVGYQFVNENTVVSHISRDQSLVVGGNQQEICESTRVDYRSIWKFIDEIKKANNSSAIKQRQRGISAPLPRKRGIPWSP